MKRAFKYTASYYRRKRQRLNETKETLTSFTPCSPCTSKACEIDTCFSSSSSSSSDDTNENLVTERFKGVTHFSVQENLMDVEEINHEEEFNQEEFDLEEESNQAKKQTSALGNSDETLSFKIRSFLPKWVVNQQIPHTAINKLLKGLTSCGVSGLPKDSRTLIGTPKTVNIVKMGNGYFWYHGLRNCLSGIENYIEKSDLRVLKLSFNMDGLPIVNSSKSQFWPVLVKVTNIIQFPPQIVAIFSGESKPPSVNDYLQKFVGELQELLEAGLQINNNQFSIQIDNFICDTPARSFIKYMSRGDSWPGRICCSIPHGESCRRACVTATSSDDLSRSCRQSDEIAFFSCIDKQERGEQCCSNTLSGECLDVCRDIFRSQVTPTKYQRERLKEECERSSPKVVDCVKDIVKVTPAKNTLKHIHCCDKSNNFKCRETCKEVLSKKTTVQEIYDELALGGCGLPLPQDPFWQCFLYPTSDEPNSSTSMETSRIERVGMDSAKWHCCQRANSTQCARLCSKTFTKSWATSWEDFHHKCLSNVNEEGLRNCIDEVDEPCELGCDGLSFCTNFNNRPTELFRSCTSQADEAARSEVTLWQNQKNITLPGLLTLPLKSIEKCSNIWKAVACTLQIRPCSRQSHANQICRDVCLEILSQCTDWTRLSPIYSAERICDSLSPDDPNMSCIRINDYLVPSPMKYPRLSGQVSSPCKANPCESSEICVINKDCIHGTDCKPFACLPACKLGEVSQYMVSDGTYVRIPIPNNPKGCLKICKCNKKKIEDCQPLPCVSLTSCLLGSSQQLHGSTFNIDCNICSCYASELICSKKQCESSSVGGKNTAYTTLPCNCPLHYVPVCGRNGITYPSACLAKCAGLSDADIELLPCQNPCKQSICPIGQKCVPAQQTCLSLMHKPCRQYECINGSSNCANLPKDPVCDVENRQYDNSCLLAHHNAKLAYRGPCLNRCRHKGQVCGINGRTYSSECAAHADMQSVDYEGSCSFIGLITNVKSKQCSNVKCNNLADPNCLGITPPGACCPLCGGSLRLLYSRKQIDRALYALQDKSTEPVNLKSLLKGLERQIQVAQCTVRGYVTVETDIFVVVQSTERYPSLLQMEACVREAEKIASLVNMQSPRIASELSLSSLTMASIVHTEIITSGGEKVAQNLLILIIVMFLLQLKAFINV